MVRLKARLKTRVIFLFCALSCLLSSGSLANELENPSAEEGYLLLNRIRSAAGMDLFFRNNHLERSALNHANYLAANGRVGHSEEKGEIYFTGATFDDRALEAGYESRYVSENLSTGQKSIAASLEGLMGAIYHRLGFLDFTRDEVGIGITLSAGAPVYVFNMGNSATEKLCRTAVFKTSGRIYKGSCKHVEQVSAERMDELLQKSRKSNPPIVFWPPENAEQVPTAFFEETPDPLPDLSVSGYPISIQFNPHFFREVEVILFKLRDLEKNIEVWPVRLLSKETDPNGELTNLQFALFPLKRLDWGKTYQAEVTYKGNNQVHKRVWRFRTKVLQHPTFVINGHNEGLRLESDQEYWIHAPAKGSLQIIKELRWVAPPGMKIDVTMEDQNTLSVRASGAVCDAARFTMSGNRRFLVQIDRSDNLNPSNHYPSLDPEQCVLPIMRDRPGYMVEGVGEQLELKNGQEYWIRLKKAGLAGQRIRSSYPKSLKITMEQVSKNTFRIKAIGKIGQKIDFQLEGGGTFSGEIIR